MKGSVTVEAAYIFPFCFIIIAIVCCLGIFQYNLAVLKMTGYECILCTVGELEEGSEFSEDNLAQSAETSARNRILAIRDLETSVKVTASKISVKYSGTQFLLNIPFEVMAVYERTFPELTLRLTHGITGE